MNRTVKLALALGAAAVLALFVWVAQGRDPAVPTAPAPRGEFASDRASDEPVRP